MNQGDGAGSGMVWWEKIGMVVAIIYVTAFIGFIGYRMSLHYEAYCIVC